MRDGVAVRCARTVAVAEDDPDIRWLLESWLKDAGFDLQVYATYDEALMGFSAAQPVNAIIADCIDCGYITPTESDRARLAELASHAPKSSCTRRAHGRTTPPLLRHWTSTPVVPKPTDFTVLLAALDHAFREH